MENGKIELPVGFGMALAMNEAAMESFESLSEEGKRNILSQIHNINSKEEMHAFVDKLCDNCARGSYDKLGFIGLFV